MTFQRRADPAADSRATAQAKPLPLTRAKFDERLTRTEFDERFDRCFALVWAYVSRCTADGVLRERIVTEVLAGSVDVLMGQRDEPKGLRFLKAASDRLIADATGARVATSASRR